MKKTILLFIAFVLCTPIYAQKDIKARIFTNKRIVLFNFEVYSGSYILQDSKGSEQKKYKEGDIVKIERKNNTFLLICEGDSAILSNSFSLHGTGFFNIFKIKIDNKNTLFDDDLVVFLKNGETVLLNDISLEHYVAGVVQAETGIAQNSEFYKAQAVAARTFTLKNLNKHAADAYNLCDQTCCQVYFGRCSNTEILMATSKTAGEVLVDSMGKLIVAVFHSNSGGQTCNSEDVWGQQLPYLRSINDPYSLAQPRVYWQKTIDRTEWINYLKNKFKYPINDPTAVDKIVNFSQNTRMSFITANIDLRTIRKDFNLRSTFFSIKEDGNNLMFSGRGYGHGVGLSQEGAMNMAKLGFSYSNILKFYYIGTEIKNISEINLEL